MKTLYIVNALDPCGYDSWAISYHKTRKGALKFIMACTYANWNQYRYITPGSYEDERFYITEGVLSE